MISGKTKFGLKAISYLVWNIEAAPVQISVISATENTSLADFILPN
jgi:DNA-binding IscR family transcriptional regulator